MTDETLARQTCEMLGLDFAYIGDAGDIVCGHGDVTRPYSWPDLSAAALRHVEALGWVLNEIDNNDPGPTVTLMRADHVIHEGWVGPTSTALYRAFCAAAVAAQEVSRG